jgi:hypothetical protein
MNKTMANRYRGGRRFAEMTLNVTKSERTALITRVREAIARETDANGARLQRLQQFLAKLDRRTSGAFKVARQSRSPQ